MRRVLLRKALEKRLLKDVSLQRLEKKTAERYLQKRLQKRLPKDVSLQRLEKKTAERYLQKRRGKRQQKRLQMKIFLRSLKIYSLSVLGAGIAPVDLTTLSSLRACWTLKTVVECKFLTSPSNPFVTSCVSDAQNCGEMQCLRSPSDLFVTSCVSDAQKMW